MYSEATSAIPRLPSSGDGNPVKPAAVFLFGPFCLDRETGGLFRLGGGLAPVPVRLGSRALDILELLLERHGRLVSRRDIMAAAWPQTVVEEANLTVQISALRRALGTGGKAAWIQTVPRRGYRLVGEVIVCRQGDSSWQKRPSLAAGPGPAPSTEATILHLPGTAPARAGAGTAGVAAARAAEGARVAFCYQLDGWAIYRGEQVELTARLLDSHAGEPIWAEQIRSQRGAVPRAAQELIRRLAVRLTNHLTERTEREAALAGARSGHHDPVRLRREKRSLGPDFPPLS